MDFKKLFRGPIIYIVIAVIGIGIGWSVISASGTTQVSTQEGLKALNDDKVSSATIFSNEQRVDLVLKDGDAQQQFYYSTPRGDEVVTAINDADLKDFDDTVTQTSWFDGILSLLIPILLLGLLFWFLMSSAQGGGSKVMQFGKSRAKLVSKESPTVTFQDVAGADEAI